MTTYSTKITAMYTVNTPDPDYVVNVLFTVTGVDGDYTASIDGNVQFSQTTSDKEFIPYSSLTQTEVLAWIDTATNNLQNYYANIDGQIASMITPPISPANTELPWVTAENAKVAEFNAKTFTI